MFTDQSQHDFFVSVVFSSQQEDASPAASSTQQAFLCSAALLVFPLQPVSVPANSVATIMAMINLFIPISSP
jgi:hypothetical protein